MGGLGSVVGLLLGGALTEYLSWRWVLFINVPIAVLVLIGTGVLVPGDTERGTLDVPGAITATLGIGSLIFALTRGNTNGWNDAGTLASFAAGAVLLAAFVLIERFSRAPASAWPPAGWGHGCSARCPPGSSSRPGCFCAPAGWPGTRPC
jgi:MFS family permease